MYVCPCSSGPVALWSGCGRASREGRFQTGVRRLPPSPPLPLLAEGNQPGQSPAGRGCTCRGFCPCARRPAAPPRPENSLGSTPRVCTLASAARRFCSAADRTPKMEPACRATRFLIRLCSKPVHAGRPAVSAGEADSERRTGGPLGRLRLNWTSRALRSSSPVSGSSGTSGAADCACAAAAAASCAQCHAARAQQRGWAGGAARAAGAPPSCACGAADGAAVTTRSRRLAACRASP